MNPSELHPIYHPEIPGFISSAAATAPMQRLKQIGMNCGCEYTSFHMFRGMERYSRYDHSIGAALIVWHFTGDVRQSMSALLHDISTPAFAHVVDFLHGDHMRQESTEDRTLEFIAGDGDLRRVLDGLGLSPEDVSDYHLFPIADNDTPRLSSDRLEYTCGNMLNYRFADLSAARTLYDDLIVGINEDGEEEIMFRTRNKASEFARLSLQCSKIYVCDADRFAMQRLAEILAGATVRGTIAEQDLYISEEHVIEALEKDPAASEEWRRFKSYSRTVRDSCSPESRRIDAKKRHINPFVIGEGRVTDYDNEYKEMLDAFLNTSFDYKVSAE